MKQVVVGILLVSCINSTASGSELVNLDDFIAGIEKGVDEGCTRKGLLAEFGQQLIGRYSFEHGGPRPNVRVTIPRQFARAIGKAKAENGKDYTVVHVPIIGVYRGLRTREIIIYAGHSNGISATHILFDAPKPEVERVLGEDLARTRQALAADEVTRVFGFRTEIVSEGMQSKLVCDLST